MLSWDTFLLHRFHLTYLILEMKLVVFSAPGVHSPISFHVTSYHSLVYLNVEHSITVEESEKKMKRSSIYINVDNIIITKMLEITFSVPNICSWSEIFLHSAIYNCCCYQEKGHFGISSSCGFLLPTSYNEMCIF